MWSSCVVGEEVGYGGGFTPGHPSFPEGSGAVCGAVSGPVALIRLTLSTALKTTRLLRNSTATPVYRPDFAC
jgi:hypothetical protein